MKLSELIKKNLFNFLIVFFIFFLDQISKYLVLKYFNNSLDQTIIVNSFLSLNLIWNNGIAFGFLQFDDKLFYNFITLLIFAILFFVSWLIFKSKGLEKISFLMILGGGLGNVFDRIYHGSVVDFIDVNYKNFHWFIFNVADIFITIGVILLIFLETLKKKMIKSLLIVFFVFLSACTAIEDTLTLKKKPSGDEFLVEKKSPLVKPPDFNKLPQPTNIKKDEDKVEQLDVNKIETLLKKKEITSSENDLSGSSLEKLILEKIK